MEHNEPSFGVRKMLALILAISLLLAPALVQAGSALVSNLSEAADGTLYATGGQWFASPFVTDSNANTLTSVTYKLTPGQFPEPELSFARLYASDAEGMPGTLLAELTNPIMNNGILGDYVFTASSPIELEPNTRYLVMLGSTATPADQRASWHYTLTDASTGPGTMPGGCYYSFDDGASWGLGWSSRYPLFEVTTEVAASTTIRKEIPVSFSASASMFFKAALLNADTPDEAVAIILPDGTEVQQRTSDGAIVESMDKMGNQRELTPEELAMIANLGLDTGWVPNGSPIQLRIFFNVSSGDVEISQSGKLVVEYEAEDVGPGMDVPVTLSWVGDPGQGSVYMDGGVIFGAQYNVGIHLCVPVPFVDDPCFNLGGSGDLPGVPQGDMGWLAEETFLPFILGDSTNLHDSIGGTSFMVGPDIGVGWLQIGANITGDAYGTLTGQELCLDLNGSECILANGARIERILTMSSASANTSFNIPQDYNAQFHYTIVMHIEPDGCVGVGALGFSVEECITDFVSTPSFDQNLWSNENVPLNFNSAIAELVIDGILPEITATYPEEQAPVGTDVTITGNHFGVVEGSVLCGTTSATIVSWSQNQIVATVPQGAGNGLCVETVVGTSPVYEFGNATDAPQLRPLISALHPNYPNPFNPTTTIQFDLAQTEIVQLRVYDVTGRLVRRLVSNEAMPAGSHTTFWNGRDDLGRSVSSGVYFYKLNAGAFDATRRMALIK